MVVIYLYSPTTGMLRDESRNPLGISLNDLTTYYSCTYDNGKYILSLARGQKVVLPAQYSAIRNHLKNRRRKIIVVISI